MRRERDLIFLVCRVLARFHCLTPEVGVHLVKGWPFSDKGFIQLT